MNTSARKSIFTSEILAACNKIPGRSLIYRDYLKSTVLNLVEDLCAVNRLPMHFANLKPEAIIRLVSHWQQNQLHAKTIQNRLSVLRTLVRLHELKLKIPSNASLNVKVPPKENPITSKKIDSSALQLPPMQIIFALQQHFGLKKTEALQFNFLMIKPEALIVPRKTSYNKTERSIPILTPTQTDLAKSILEQDLAPLSRDNLRLRALIHTEMCVAHGITHPDYFRHVYIYDRYETLSQTHTKREALQIIAKETGYSSFLQIKEILSCKKDIKNS